MPRTILAVRSDDDPFLAEWVPPLFPLHRCYCVGASGLDDPANSRFPSLNVTVDTFATGLPLRACQPSTWSTVPTLRSSGLHPRRINVFPEPVSSAQFTIFPSVSTSI